MQIKIIPPVIINMETRVSGKAWLIKNAEIANRPIPRGNENRIRSIRLRGGGSGGCDKSKAQ